MIIHVCALCSCVKSLVWNIMSLLLSTTGRQTKFSLTTLSKFLNCLPLYIAMTLCYTVLVSKGQQGGLFHWSDDVGFFHVGKVPWFSGVRCVLHTLLFVRSAIDLMHWRQVSITTTPCWGSRLVALRASAVLEERWLSVGALARRYGMQGLARWLHAWRWRTWQCLVWPPTRGGALLWRHMHKVYRMCLLIWIHVSWYWRNWRKCMPVYTFVLPSVHAWCVVLDY